MSVHYDPPSGWRYGFPREYKPKPGESVVETLIRDGYPSKDAEFGAKHCRFLGPSDEIKAMFPDIQEDI